MNRINQLFQEKKNNILSIYITAGYPNLNSTAEQIKYLAASGVDMIEIGMPFSDPLADGPVIQQSSQLAIQNGMSLKKLFSDLKDIRKEVKIPLLLMGYLNPVMQYGIENFCKDAVACGIDGFIIPDLPLQEYEENFKDLFEQNQLNNIFLISPQTSEDRIEKIDSLSNGFIYAVSSSSTTGNKLVNEGQEAYFSRIKNMQMKNPFMIGFGITNKESFQISCKYAQGAIIGTAYIRHIGENYSENSVRSFVSKFL